MGYVRTFSSTLSGMDRDGDSNSVPWHYWAHVRQLLISMRVLRHRAGLLTFENSVVREAVRRYYGLDSAECVNLVGNLRNFYLNREEDFPRSTDELAWLLVRLEDRDNLLRVLSRVNFFARRFAQGRMKELTWYWSFATRERADTVKALSDAYLENLGKMRNDPEALAPSRVAAIYEALSRFLRDSERFDLAVTPLERVLELRESLNPDGPEVGRSLVLLARLNVDWRNDATAEALYRSALDIFDDCFDEERIIVAETLEALASLYWRQGKRDAARPLQGRADSIKRRKRNEGVAGERGLTRSVSRVPSNVSTPLAKRPVDERRQRVAATMFNVGVHLCQRQKHSDAFPLFQQALGIYETTLGPSHPLVAETLKNAALAKFHMDDLDAAATLYRRATEIRDEVPLSDPALLDTSINPANSRRSSSDTMSTVKFKMNHISASSNK